LENETPDYIMELKEFDSRLLFPVVDSMPVMADAFPA